MVIYMPRTDLGPLEMLYEYDLKYEKLSPTIERETNWIIRYKIFIIVSFNDFNLEFASWLM